MKIPSHRVVRIPLRVVSHTGLSEKRNGELAIAAMPNVWEVTQISLAPLSSDFLQITLKIAKPSPATEARTTPITLKPSTPLAVPTKIIPTIVTDVPKYQFSCGFSRRMRYATIAEKVGAVPRAVTVAIAIPVESTALKNVN